MDYPALMDPRTMGILSAAFQGLNASGPSRMPVSMGQVIGQAGQSGLGTYMSMAEANRKAAQTQAMIDLEKQSAALKELQIKQGERNQAIQEKILRDAGLLGGDPAAPGAALPAQATPMAPGAPAAPVGPSGGVPAGLQTPGQPGRGGFPFSLNQLTAMRLAGMPDLLQNFKESQPNISIQNGMMVDPRVGVVGSVPQTNQQGFSTMTVPDGKGGYRVQVVPGAEDAYRAQQDIAEGAKASRDLVNVPPTAPNEPPRQLTREQRVREVSKPLYDLKVDLGDGNKINISGASAELLLDAARKDPTILANLSKAVPVASGGSAAGMSPQAEAQQVADAAQGKQVAENYGKIYNDLQNASMQNPAKIAKFRQIGSLLNGFEGGKLSKTGYEIARAGNSLGLKIDPKLPNKEAAEAMASEIALELRSTSSGGGMPGAMSDADREFLKGMAPNMAQTDQGRKAIIDARVKVMERDSKIAEMARAYRAKHGKIDDDFFNQLQSWSNRNPIFGKK